MLVGNLEIETSNTASCWSEWTDTAVLKVEDHLGKWIWIWCEY